jgi:hypothetical protein
MAVFLKNTNSMGRFRKTRKGGDIGDFFGNLFNQAKKTTQGISEQVNDAGQQITNAANSGLSAVSSGFNTPVNPGPIGGRSRRRRSRRSRRTRSRR